jgi:hypothetical protein
MRFLIFFYRRLLKPHFPHLFRNRDERLRIIIRRFLDEFQIYSCLNDQENIYRLFTSDFPKSGENAVLAIFYRKKAKTAKAPPF